MVVQVEQEGRGWWHRWSRRAEDGGTGGAEDGGAGGAEDGGTGGAGGQRMVAQVE